ncbi:carbohydrate ABC transporter membrane protein 1, CUT1 family [Micromonospora echinaurantiaca]|uniref:Carbohydrate ABC transporter membrane protein 1, CUT1 family n=1 Tax=Micromonospora echinaurantiaca TaxID=47857 RepID=A0A1C5I332_9ACTN|nr:sugar ABC transporter permease [Micromonospora echinaurantiaca]SCG52633.1 carbohydrate ABC transporter membrane protein 1, CUT1 family [Micromonospora echinaurantiaca]
MVALPGRPARRLRRPSAREAGTALLFVLPFLLLFAVFRFGPAIAGVILGFTDYTVGGETSWTGLENFRRLVDDPTFWSALRVTVIFTVLSVPLSMLASLGMALLTRRAFRGAKLFRSIFFLPVVTSLVLAGVVFSWVFSEGGPWSRAMGALGLPAQSWLADSVLVIPALVLVSVWSRFGYGMLILLARLQDVPAELEEAALTDGASAWQRFRYVTLPQLRPALFFVAIIETTVSFQVFDMIYVMTGGGPVRASYSLVYLLYDQGFKYFDLGYASAVGVALFVMTIVVALIQRLTLGREN